MTGKGKLGKTVRIVYRHSCRNDLGVTFHQNRVIDPRFPIFANTVGADSSAARAYIQEGDNILAVSAIVKTWGVGVFTPDTKVNLPSLWFDSTARVLAVHVLARCSSEAYASTSRQRCFNNNNKCLEAAHYSDDAIIRALSKFDEERVKLSLDEIAATRRVSALRTKRKPQGQGDPRPTRRSRMTILDAQHCHARVSDCYPSNPVATTPSQRGGLGLTVAP